MDLARFLCDYSSDDLRVQSSGVCPVVFFSNRSCFLAEDGHLDTNNKIILTIRMAYGFRNIDNLIALIYVWCGGRVIYAFLGILEILKLCCHPLFGLRIYR